MAEQTKQTDESEIPVGGGTAPARGAENRSVDRPGSRGRTGLASRPGTGMLAGWPLERDPFAALEWPALSAGELDFGRADLSETDDGYELQIDLPGMKKDDIKIDLSDGILTVSGERSDEREDKRKGYYLSERSFGSVQRSFRVPASVRSEDITARFTDGVLTLSMPKTEEARKNERSIEIE